MPSGRYYRTGIRNGHDPALAELKIGTFQMHFVLSLFVNVKRLAPVVRVNLTAFRSYFVVSQWLAVFKFI